MQAGNRGFGLCAPQLQNSRERFQFLKKKREIKIVHINSKRKVAAEVKTQERKRSRFYARSFPPSSEIRMRMWEMVRGQPRTSNWIPIAPGIQFSTRPATRNEQNSNSFHLSEFGNVGRATCRVLPHFAEPRIRSVSASILRITEGVPPNVLFTANSSASVESSFCQ